MFTNGPTQQHFNLTWLNFDNDGKPNGTHNNSKYSPCPMPFQTNHHNNNNNRFRENCFVEQVFFSCGSLSWHFWATWIRFWVMGGSTVERANEIGSKVKRQTLKYISHNGKDGKNVVAQLYALMWLFKFSWLWRSFAWGRKQIQNQIQIEPWQMDGNGNGYGNTNDEIIILKPTILQMILLNSQ